MTEGEAQDDKVRQDDRRGGRMTKWGEDDRKEGLFGVLSFSGDNGQYIF